MMDLVGSNLPIGSYLKIIFRRKQLLIALTFAGLVLGFCVSLLLPKSYKSSTIILVQEGKTDNPMFDKLAVATTVQQRMIGIKESILGWNSMVELVKRLSLAKDAHNREEFENIIMGLRRNIMLRLQGNNLIYMDYEGDDAVKTQAVVQSITDILIEKNVQMQSQETSDAIKFIEEQLEVYKGKIRSAEIAQLEDRLKILLADSTDKHPLVRQLKEQVAQKKEELRKENLKYTNDIKLSNQTVAPIVDQIKKALDSLDSKEPAVITPGGAIAPAGQVGQEKDLYKVMLIDKMDNVMARDVNVNEQIYNTLLQRLETAKITQRLQTSKEGTKYTILDPPRVPLHPTKPNKVLVSFIGLFLGLFLGIGLVLGENFLDQSFIDVEEAKNYLGVPLLGAISRITTEQEIRIQKEKERWVYVLVFVAGVFLVVATLGVSKIIR